MRVLVTRPSEQALPVVQALRALGLEAQALPLIGIAPAADPAAVAAAWHDLSSLALVMFVSANAVQQFFALRPASAQWPAALQAGSTGPGTTAALRAAGLASTQIVEPDPGSPNFDSEALWQQLRQRPWQGQRVRIVRGEGGRDWLAQTLERAGAAVDFVSAYRRPAPQLDAAQRDLLEHAIAAPSQHVWWFSSREAVAHLGAMAPRTAWRAALAVATHPRIAQAAREAGFGHVECIAPGIEALRAWLQQHSAREGGR